RVLSQAPHLTVFSFGYSNLQPTFVGVSAKNPHRRRAGLLSVNVDTLRPALQVLFIDRATDLGHVDLLSSASSVLNRLREVAIIGEQERTAGVEIQPPYGNNPDSDFPENIERGRTPLRIRHSGQHPSGLVEDTVTERLRLEPPPVEFDHASSGIRFGAQLGNDFSIHPNTTARNQCLRLAA